MPIGPGERYDFFLSRRGSVATIAQEVTDVLKENGYRVRTQISPIGFHRLIQRVGEAAKMPFPIHPHMLRHACGFKLANDGHDTRALQHYLGHKNIQHTARCTDMAPDRFKDFWRG